jgi:hypothetical protein
MDSPEDRAHAQELVRQANAAPAIGRFRVLLGFVGSGRRATQSGKLTPADAVEVAAFLGVPGAEEGEVRSMEDLPDVAQLFDWAVASELLVTRGTRVLPGLRAEDLSCDPLGAWFTAATTLLEHGLLGGFRRGWRKHYIEFLDVGVPHLLSAVLNAGGDVPLAAIKDLAWEQVAQEYDCELGDTAERPRVDRLVDAIVVEFAEAGAAFRRSPDQLDKEGLPPRAASQTTSTRSWCTCDTRSHRPRRRSTDLLERSLGEVKRRTKVMGRFPGESSCLTLPRLGRGRPPDHSPDQRHPLQRARPPIPQTNALPR